MITRLLGRCGGLFLLLAMLASAAAAQTGPGTCYQNAILKDNGRPASGAHIYVGTNASTGTPPSPLATIYSDQALTALIIQPITADSFGNFSFCANLGDYNLQVSGTGITTHTFSAVLLPANIGQVKTVTFSATPTFDCSLGTIQKIILTGNVTSSSLANCDATRGVVTFEVCQDGAGAHTFVPPAGLNQWSAIPSAISTCGAQQYVFDAAGNGYPDMMPALTGDVTSSATSVATTVVATHLPTPLPVAQGGTAQTTANYTAAFGGGPSYAGVSYATLPACAAAWPSSGGTCFVGANQANGTYTETLASDLVFTKSNSGFVFLVPYVITMGSHVVSASSSVSGEFIRSTGLGFFNQYGHWFYTGSVSAMSFGDSSGTSTGLFLEGMNIDTTGGTGTASPLTVTRMFNGRIENVTLFGAGGATTQLGFVLAGAGANCACNNKIDGLTSKQYAKNITVKDGANANTWMNIDASAASTGGVGVFLDGSVNMVEENTFQGLLTESDTTGISATGLVVNNHFKSVQNDSGITTDVNFGASTSQNTVELMRPTFGVTDTGTSNTVVDPSKYKLDVLGNVTANKFTAPTLVSTVATGTAPLSVASTTNVPNLNASTLNGATFAAPGAIGGTTPASGIFSTLATGNAGGGSGSVATPELACNEGTAPATAVNYDIIYCDSTLHRPMLSNNNGSFFALPQKIASGTATMTTGAIGAGACGTTVTVAATGVATTDVIQIADNAAVAANPGVLIINKWPTAGNVNFNYCNPTAGSVTPTAATLNWGVVR